MYVMLTNDFSDPLGKGNAVTYAQSLTKYPQEALLADRIALYQSLTLSKEMQQTLHQKRISALHEAQKVTILTYYNFYVTLFFQHLHSA